MNGSPSLVATPHFRKGEVKSYTPSPNMIPLPPSSASVAPFTNPFNSEAGLQSNVLDVATATDVDTIPTSTLPVTAELTVLPTMANGSSPTLPSNQKTMTPSISRLPALVNGTSSTPPSELQDGTPSRQVSPTLSDASSDRTHISSGMRPVLQIPPFVEFDNTPIKPPNAEIEPVKSFVEQALEQSSSEDEARGRTNRQSTGPDHSTLPKHLQQQLSRFYQLNGYSSPPPCAMNKIKQSQLEGRRVGRHPLKYINDKGERLTASCQPIGFGNKYVLIVEGKTQPPVIVKYHSITGAPAAQKQTPYLVWKGVEGFEKQPSIWKVRDDESVPDIQPVAPPETRQKTRETVVTPKPVEQTGYAIKNCQICKDRHRKCDKALPVCSTCLELNIPCHYAKGSILTEPTESLDPPSATKSVPNDKQDANSIKSKTPTIEHELSEDNTSDSEVDLGSELPTNLRKVLDQFYKAQGSKAAPPCSLTSANAHSIYAFVGSGLPARYVDTNGKRLKMTRHYLPENKTWANVIHGLEREPVFVKSQSARRNPDFGNTQAAFIVWHGVDGFEETPRVYKVANQDKHLKKPQTATEPRSSSNTPTTLKRSRDASVDDNTSKRARTSTSRNEPELNLLKALSSFTSPPAESTRSSQRRATIQTSIPTQEKAVTTKNTYETRSTPSATIVNDTSLASIASTLAPTPALAPVPASASTSSSILTPDQKKRTTVTFIGGTRSRARFFNVCDSVQKLYMQASAAGLFEKLTSPSIPFLVVNIGDSKVAVVRDDEDDFQDLETLVRDQGPWNDEDEATCLLNVVAAQ